MNAATIHAAITKAHLHVRNSQGHNGRTFQPKAGISHTLNGVAGIGVPSISGIMGRVHRGFFMPKVCLWRAGEGGRNPRRADAVRQPEPDRHPIGVGRRDTTRHQQTIMNTSPTLGTQPEIRFVSRATLEKRVRRELAKQNHKLLKSRPGTPAHREYGAYAVENDRRTVLETHLDLVKLARELGVLADHECLDPHEHWRFYAARQVTVEIEGKTLVRFDRISKDLRTLAEAESFAAGIEGAVIVHYNPMEAHRYG